MVHHCCMLLPPSSQRSAAQRVDLLHARHCGSGAIMWYGWLTGACTVLQVLTPLQDARLLVDAYPLPPDPLLLSRLVAQELGDPSAHATAAAAIEAEPPSAPGSLLPLAPALPSLEFPPLPGAAHHSLQLCSPSHSIFDSVLAFCLLSVVLFRVPNTSKTWGFISMAHELCVDAAGDFFEAPAEPMPSKSSPPAHTVTTGFI